jgi:hypothetical protein
MARKEGENTELQIGKTYTTTLPNGAPFLKSNRPEDKEDKPSFLSSVKENIIGIVNFLKAILHLKKRSNSNF